MEVREALPETPAAEGGSEVVDSEMLDGAGPLEERWMNRRENPDPTWRRFELQIILQKNIELSLLLVLTFLAAGVYIRFAMSMIRVK